MMPHPGRMSSSKSHKGINDNNDIACDIAVEIFPVLKDPRMLAGRAGRTGWGGKKAEAKGYFWQVCSQVAECLDHFGSFWICFDLAGWIQCTYCTLEWGKNGKNPVTSGNQSLYSLWVQGTEKQYAAWWKNEMTRRERTDKLWTIIGYYGYSIQREVHLTEWMLLWVLRRLKVS